MKVSWAESSYLHRQLRLGLLSPPVSSSLSISPNGFDELEGKNISSILLEKPRGNLR